MKFFNGNVAPPLVYNSCVTLRFSRWSSWSIFRNFGSTRPSKSDSTPPESLLLFNREVSTRNIRSNFRPHKKKLAHMYIRIYIYLLYKQIRTPPVPKRKRRRWRVRAPPHFSDVFRGAFSRRLRAASGRPFSARRRVRNASKNQSNFERISEAKPVRPRLPKSCPGCVEIRSKNR